MASEFTEVEVDGEPVRISSPSKVMFPAQGWTKLDLVEHYRAVWPGALRGVAGRPTVLKRFNRGVDQEPIFQKRVKGQADDQETVEITFPSGRSARMLVPRRARDVLWLAQQNCVDLNPWPVRADDVDRPDELRVDLDPTPGVAFADVRDVALAVREVLSEHGLAGYPKTSGSRGIHVYARIVPEWSFTAARRATLALAREVERRMPDVATTAWWKEERRGVFLDYNQMARDRTVASAYSVRPTGLVSTPLRWDEVPTVELADFPMDAAAARFAREGDPMAGMDDDAGRLDALLELAHRDEAEGRSDAPWPPHFPKHDDEPPRVQPSRRRR